ncbi:DUF6036 family nucleotidyltransferase [Robertmurraya beringensis]|uniref:DUF6036 family nucleotidyltransferase n=1 Tax=Robertmurraya beringensis TaxID=641660 RepID=A0ABV6KXX4_9BACI
MNKNYVVIESQEDIIRRLLILDDNIGLISLRDKVRFVIFGGAAFLLRTPFRPTSDIDVYMLEEKGYAEIEVMLNELDINTNIQRILEMPPKEDFIQRMERLDIDFQHIEVFVASAYDLIISKLFSTRGAKDAIDLIRSDLLDQVNIDELRDMWLELKSYSLFEHRYNDLDDILLSREEFKAKKVN